MTIGPRPRREHDPRRKVSRSEWQNYQFGYPYGYEGESGENLRDSDAVSSSVRWDQEERDPNWGRKTRRD